jgi:hypothetical protein
MDTRLIATITLEQGWSAISLQSMWGCSRWDPGAHSWFKGQFKGRSSSSSVKGSSRVELAVQEWKGSSSSGPGAQLRVSSRRPVQGHCSTSSLSSGVTHFWSLASLAVWLDEERSQCSWSQRNPSSTSSGLLVQAVGGTISNDCNLLWS